MRARGHFFVNANRQFVLGIEVTNMTQQTLVQDFDIRFNKNAFAVSIAGATNALTLPQPNQSAYVELPCSINKANLDGKNPPKNPFMVQIAMKTSLDVFLFQIPCMLHCLFNLERQLTEQEYQTNWQKIKDTNQLNMQYSKSQLYGGYRDAGDVLGAIEQGVVASGFACVTRSDTHRAFGAMTVNNLPVLFEVKYDQFTESCQVLSKFAVPPIKDLQSDCISHVLLRPSSAAQA